MAGVCSVCSSLNNTAVPVGIVGGTFSPGPLDATTSWAKLMDYTTTTTGTNAGAQTSAAFSNYIQVQLSAAFDDIAYVRMWAGLTTAQTTSANLTIWLSPTTNFTANGTVCARGVTVIADSEGSFPCPPATAIQYVTVQRFVADMSESLVIHELYVYSSSECRGCHACAVASAVSSTPTSTAASFMHTLCVPRGPPPHRVPSIQAEHCGHRSLRLAPALRRDGNWAQRMFGQGYPRVMHQSIQASMGLPYRTPRTCSDASLLNVDPPLPLCSVPTG